MLHTWHVTGSDVRGPGGDHTCDVNVVFLLEDPLANWKPHFHVISVQTGQVDVQVPHEMRKCPVLKSSHIHTSQLLLLKMGL